MKWSIDLEYFKLPTNSRRYILNNDEQLYLQQMYVHLYPHLHGSDLSIPSSIRKYYTVIGPLFRYNSSGEGSNVLANWAEQAQINTDNQDQTPGKVHYYFTHSIMLNNVLTQHLIAYVMWYEPHPDRNKLGKPLELWYKDMFQTTGPSSYIPIQRISNKFVFCTTKNLNEMIVCPLIPKYYF